MRLRISMYLFARVARQLKRAYIVPRTTHCYPHSLSSDGSASTATVHTDTVAYQCACWKELMRTHSWVGLDLILANYSLDP